MTVVLAIETSCDETAAAVVEDGRVVRSSVVSSQIDLHARFGGVVPEVAGRAHLESLTAVVDEALEQAGTTGAGIDAVGVTIGPGLIGSLLVGVAAAKAYSLAWEVPFVGVNHLEGHLHAAFLEDPDLALPAVVLLVSGGHTMLIHMQRDGTYRLLGQTIDDAAGEAFDKVARYLGLGYPGGPVIDRLAADGDPHAIAFPRGLRGAGLDFSFSGLKTSVVTWVRKHPDAPVADVAASFQEAVVDILVEKTRQAAAAVGAKAIAIGGGVAANSSLRARIQAAAEDDGRGAFIPSRAMCTDNAAMVGATAWYRLRADGPTPLTAAADPNLRLAVIAGG
ncbi:tRNA (adenosine(37)-N6)-threonylcarbamoyltransferase complex transferase subunit TsaD [Acidiferrimicrobium sp. IK]|uniref:tRNA (adenosine(37)-N6)-threonylcarbamoyltransferase complex transferase subunit TsaD n=1 Tax=Acidiferrimicrobium sp. IK TaxID=2871700 RepID=UPI0021CB1FFB|nr:tRNA (adenosine(37)-N6)-threonylcarbamoyltransferase complex transferase subunit TsaD [Acidiferrimicrobium sp. IK]MCU4184993.1 tRNA (adenosine(37)-N6)-threonylcarbamoyltransferase complex transferase subunit TsaD [Acidiferrimicrobium sp. IK]